MDRRRALRSVGVAGRGPATGRGGTRLNTDGDEHGSKAQAPAEGPRSRAQVALIIAAVILIPLGLLVVFLAFTRGERQNQTALTPQNVAAGEAVPVSALNGQWAIIPGPDSWVGYSVGEELLRVPTPNTAEGRTTAVDGGIVLSDGTVIAVAVNADVSQMHSDDPERDETLTTRGLETSKYPNATFTLTAPITLSEPPTAGRPVTVQAKGDLTMHGVTKPVELALQAQVLAGNPPTLEVVGDIPITFSDFGMEAPNIANVVSVQDHGTLKIHLRLARAPEKPASATGVKATTGP